MKVLFVGALSGFYARDDATIESLLRHPSVEVVVIGGNARTALLPRTRNIPSPNGASWTLEAIVQIARSEYVDFAVVGADEPLGAGLVDLLEAVSVPTFGPDKKGAQLESSKATALEWMQDGDVPCAESCIFRDGALAQEFAKTCALPKVVKTDGFAVGKGVELCETREQIEACVADFIKRFPGKAIIFQEKLEGVEISVFAFTDGVTVSNEIACCDYKPRFEDDKGPMTGSMGSFSPPSFWVDRLAQIIRVTILERIVEVMRQKGIVYRGVIYAGLMLTAEGPKVLEFNCRLGDSEGQVILQLLESDLFSIMLACRLGTLRETPVVWNRELVAGTVVMVDENYPGRPKHAGAISGLNAVVEEGVTVYEYGTVLIPCENGDYVALGGSGRRLSPTATGKSIEEVFLKIYCVIGTKGKDLTFLGEDWRSDIGKIRELPPELVSIYT